MLPSCSVSCIAVHAGEQQDIHLIACILAQEWLAREDDTTAGAVPAAAVAKAGAGAHAGAACLRTRTPSLEQAGGLQRMTLRGHTGGVSKVLLAPGGIDVITGAYAHTSTLVRCSCREALPYSQPGWLSPELAPPPHAAARKRCNLATRVVCAYQPIYP